MFCDQEEEKVRCSRVWRPCANQSADQTIGLVTLYSWSVAYTFVLIKIPFLLSIPTMDSSLTAILFSYRAADLIQVVLEDLFLM